MDAHQALLPEWQRILHPPLEPDANRLSEESRAEGKPEPQKF
jgi:hypothetical protein